jgi:Amt family ammonium transporter
VLYKLTDVIIPLRVSSDQEELGLDLSQHGRSDSRTQQGVAARQNLAR